MNQRECVLSDELFRCITDDASDGWTAIQDLSLRIQKSNTVGSLLDHCPKSLFTLNEPLFHPSLVRDVVCSCNGALNCTGLIMPRTYRCHERARYASNDRHIFKSERNPALQCKTL